MNPTSSDTAWRCRAIALTYYLGAAPFAWLRRGRQKNPFLAHHQRLSLAILLLLAFVSIQFLCSILAASYSLVNFRELYESYHFEGWLFWLSRKLYLCWIVFWLYGAGLALAGSMGSLPLAHYFEKRTAWLHATAGFALSLYTLAGAALLLAGYAQSYMRSDEKPGQVYMVYEDLRFYPRWIFVLGFFPMARASQEIYGPGQAVLLRLSKENIARAVKEGRIVVLATHGGKKGILLDTRRYMPASEAETMGTNPNLAYVYLTSCDGGAQEEGWKRAFAPARVITFPRLSAIVEHIWWLWMDAPGVVREIGPAPVKSESQTPRTDAAPAGAAR